MQASSGKQAAWVRSMSRMLAVVILMAGMAFAGHEQAAHRKIIVFREGTTRQVHRQVVERHRLEMLHDLTLLNAVTIALTDETSEMALAALQADRRVLEIHNDRVIAADHVVSITPVPLPDGEIFP